nr:hypothetical protein [Tanacetum cinerariifolium]
VKSKTTEDIISNRSFMEVLVLNHYVLVKNVFNLEARQSNLVVLSQLLPLKFSNLSTNILEFSLQIVKILLYDYPTFSKTFYVVFYVLMRLRDSSSRGHHEKVGEAIGSKPNESFKDSEKVFPVQGNLIDGKSVSSESNGLVMQPEEPMAWQTDYGIMKEELSILRGRKYVPGMNSREREMERKVLLCLHRCSKASWRVMVKVGTVTSTSYYLEAKGGDGGA